MRQGLLPWHMGLDRLEEWRQRLPNPLTPRSHSEEEPEEVYAELEGAVRGALPPVKPPADFRASLRDNLTLVAQGKRSGLILEYPNPFRQGIIIGVSAGVLAAGVAILVLILHLRVSRSHESG